MDPSNLAKLLMESPPNSLSPEQLAQILSILSQPNPSLDVTVASPNPVNPAPSGGSFAVAGSFQPLLPPSPNHTPWAQHQLPSTSLSSGLPPAHESPKGSMKMKTGGGGTAKGHRAIGGNGGDIRVGAPDAKSGKDSANLGTGVVEARAGHGGTIQSLGMLLDAQRTYLDVDFETGEGGNAESTETTHDQTDSNDPGNLVPPVYPMQDE